MCIRYIAVLPAIVCCMIGADSRAATVTYSLYLGGFSGRFALLASASLGDNGGIASYGIPLQGVLTLNHRSPYGVSSTNFSPSGFSNLRSADGVGNVFAGQPLAGPAENYLFGIGQTSGSFASLGIPIAGYPDPSSDNTWGVPLVIATGTFTHQVVNYPASCRPTPTCSRISSRRPGNSANKIGAQINTQIIPGPHTTEHNHQHTGRARDQLRTGDRVRHRYRYRYACVEQSATGRRPRSRRARHSGHALSRRAFSWDPTGSKTGPKGSGRVEYRWTATVTDFLGSTTGAAFSVVLIPEPATLLLAALAALTVVLASAGRLASVNRWESP